MQKLIVTLTTAIALAAIAMSGANAAPSIGGAAHSLDQDELIPALTKPETASDALPDDSDIAEQAKLNKSSTRLIGDGKQGQQWVALDDSGNICLVAALNDTSDITGASCVSPAQFYKFGASLRLENGDPEGVVAHILPNDVEMDPARAADDAGVDSNSSLIVMDLDAADEQGNIEVPRDAAENIVLHPMSPKQ